MPRNFWNNFLPKVRFISIIFIKHHFFAERRNHRLDDLIIEVYTWVIPALLIKLQIFQVDDKRPIKILKKAVRNLEETTQMKKLESLKIVSTIKEGLEQGKLDPNIVHSTLKILLEKINSFKK